MKAIVEKVMSRTASHRASEHAQMVTVCNYNDDYYGDKMCIAKPVDLKSGSEPAPTSGIGTR